MRVREWEDGRGEILCAGQTLPYSIFDKNPHVAAGAIVENKRLGKERILAARQPPTPSPRTGHFYLAENPRALPDAA